MGWLAYPRAGGIVRDAPRRCRDAGGKNAALSPVADQAEIGERQSSEPEVPDTSWVQMILR